MNYRKHSNAVVAAILSGVLSLPATSAGAVGGTQQVQLKVRFAEVSRTVALQQIAVKESRSSGFFIGWDKLQSVATGSGGSQPKITFGVGFGNEEHPEEGHFGGESGLGIDLNFFPTISDNGTKITLKLLEKTGQKLGNVGLAGDDIVVSIPRSVSRDVNTMVVVAGGTTLAVGGLTDVRKSGYDNSIPSFGQIPVVGSLFKADVLGNQQRELVIFITPRLVKNR